jgi:hypothetical protein
MMDPTRCHYCNKNRVNPKDKYSLPNGIELCEECAARHSTDVQGKEAQMQLTPESTRSPKEQAAQKLLEQMKQNKAARKRKKQPYTKA